MLIRLIDYAAAHGKDRSNVVKLVKQGRIPAVRQGKIWYVDSQTPYPEDRRKVKK